MAVLISILFAMITGLIVGYSWKYGISPTPTSAKVKRTLLEILPPLTADSTIAEFGSGWGTLSFALASKYPSCIITALEISPVPYFCSLWVARLARYKNLVIHRRDLFEFPLQSTKLVVCYLYPGAMERLKVKFEKELAPDAFVVSHTFAVPGWKPVRMMRATDLYGTPIYLYRGSSKTPI